MDVEVEVKVEVESGWPKKAVEAGGRLKLASRRSLYESFPRHPPKFFTKFGTKSCTNISH